MNPLEAIGRHARGYPRAALPRHVLYVAALVALFVVCRQGQQWPVVIATLVAYVVAATLVVRWQHATWLSADEPKTPPYRVLWTTLAGGLACVAIGLVGGWVLEHRGLGWLLFVGIIAGYLSTGALLTRARTEETAARQQTIGLWGSVLCGFLTLLGLGLVAAFDDLPGWLLLLAGACVAVGLLAAPVGAALLAERAVDVCSGAWDQRARTVVALMVAGGVVSVGAAGAVAWWYGAAWLFVALLAVAGLAVAIVSGTLADVFAVLGIIALMGVTPQQEPLPEALKPGEGQQVLVALGDSYMSGEGADTYYEGTDTGGENQCRRAPTAWAVQAAQRYFNGLVFLACSGARTYNVRHDAPRTQTPEPRPQDGEPGTQLDQYDDLLAARGFDADLVVLSIGGNDAGFSTIGKACAVPGSCDTEDMRSWFTNELPQVERELESTFQQVRQTFPDTPVAITAYPDPIYMEPGETEPCDDLALSAGDVRFIKDFLGRLNDAVKAAADANGLAFVAQTEQALARAGMQLCDPVNGSRPGVNFVGLRSVSGLADQRFNPLNWIHNSFHPNERGHTALLRAFDTWWAETGSELTAPGPLPEGTDMMDGVEIEPQCDLVGDGMDQPKCRSNADDWTLHQLAQAAIPWSLVVLLVALPAWLFSVAFFGWRRRVGQRRAEQR
jgi:lysophospholipase L1-like esterase